MNDLTISPLVAIEMARDAAADIKERQDVTRRALAEFCIRAMLDGTPTAEIITAAKFEAEPQQGFLGGSYDLPADIAFAQWLAREVMEMAAPGSTA